jgi:hypothetical protein
MCEVSFTLAPHEFVRTFHVLRGLRAADIVLGLSWLDDEQATLQFGETSFNIDEWHRH